LLTVSVETEEQLWLVNTSCVLYLNHTSAFKHFQPSLDSDLKILVVVDTDACTCASILPSVAVCVESWI